MNVLLEETVLMWKTFALHRKRLRSDPRRISVAIPTHNRADRVLRLVPTLLRDPRIGEIVVRDDASDTTDFTRLQAGLAPLAPRVRLARNAANLGALGNKLAVIADGRLDWVILLDSDNGLTPAYLDRLFALPVWSERVIYCPQQARPQFDFSFLTDTTLDLDTSGQLLTTTRYENFCVFLNTGNYFLPARRYLDALQPYADRKVAGADVIFANTIWLLNGGLLHVVPGLTYDHAVHEGSWFRVTATASKALAATLAGTLARRDTATLVTLLETLGEAHEQS